MRAILKFFILLILLATGALIYLTYKDDIASQIDTQLAKLNSFIAEEETPPASEPEALATAPPAAANEISVHFIDLGQADAILVRSGANAALIDGGERKTQNALIKYLREAGIKNLDYVVATHPHSDHIGGLAEVIRRFNVKNVLMPDAINNTATFENLLSAIEEKGLSVTVPSEGDKITTGLIEFTVLAPVGDVKETDLNNASIVLRMAYGNTAFLFTGDAEIHSEKKILSNKRGPNLRATVLKAGHHGSRTATSKEFLDAVRPSVVVVMCGKDNSYKHPHKEFLDIVNDPARNISLLRTDESGTIVISTDGREIKTYFVNKKRGPPSVTL